jgi:hypothetical protein
VWVRRKLSAVAGLVWACGCAPESTPAIATQQQPITNAQANPGSPAVAYALSTVEQAGVLNTITSCSATLVAESPDATSSRFLLSARHCFRLLEADDEIGLPIGYEVSSEQVTVQFGDTQSALGKPYRIVALTLHPDADLAWLVLDRPGPVQPAILNFTSLEPYVGDEVDLTGFGATAGDLSDAGDKHTGVTSLLTLDPARASQILAENYGTAVSPDFAHDLTVHFGELLFTGNQPGGTESAHHCPGDSGGAAFMNIDGAEVVVGVISASLGIPDPSLSPPRVNCSDQNSLNSAVRIDRYQDWISSLLADRADSSAGKDPPPDGVRRGGCAVSGQGTGLFWVVLSILLTRRGRRRSLGS